MSPPGILARTLALLRAEADTGTRVRLAASMLLVCGGGMLAALAPLALKALVDALALPHAPTGLAPSSVLLGALYLAALCGGRLLGEIRSLLTATAEQRLRARVSRRFFDHLMGLPLAFHVGRRSGALTQSLTQATLGCQLLVTTVVSGAAPVLVELVMVIAVLFHLDQPALVASFAATAVAYLTVSGMGAMRIKARAKQVSRANLETHAALADSLVNVESIKCQAVERAVSDRFAAASSQLQARAVALHRQRARTGLGLTATFAVSMAASLAIAAEALGRGTLSIGGFVLVTVYLLQLVRPLEILGAAARDLAQALEYVRPLLDVLRMPTEVAALGPPPERSATARLPARGPMGLSLRGIHLAYDGGPPVLRGLDLDIQPGSTVGIVGASGAGKTSLIRLLLRLYTPQSGRICLGGVPIDSVPVAELRAAIGVVPQDTVLLNASIASNIAMARPDAQAAEIEAAARTAQLHGFILSLPDGYATQVGERGLKLSGGERQRIAIARLTLRRPRVLLFDEATSMLDAHTELAVLQALKQLGQGCTTLIIAHRLTAVQHADEIVVLHEGRVVERGSPRALRRADGPYALMWRAQMGNDAPGGGPAAVPARAAPGH